MPYDGLPARAGTGAREAAADRQAVDVDAGTRRRPVKVPTTAAVRTQRRGLRLAALGITAIGLVIAACGTTSNSGGVAGATGTAPASVAASESAATSPSGSGGLNQGFMTFQEMNASKVL